MQISTLTQALCLFLLGNGALASVARDTNGNAKLANLRTRDCHHNNCLRAMIARPELATTFCTAYNGASLGDFATWCAVDEISDACYCAVKVRPHI
jgi:hypothetical protein